MFCDGVPRYPSIMPWVSNYFWVLSLGRQVVYQVSTVWDYLRMYIAVGRGVLLWPTSSEIVMHNLDECEHLSMVVRGAWVSGRSVVLRWGWDCGEIREGVVVLQGTVVLTSQRESVVMLQGAVVLTSQWEGVVMLQGAVVLTSQREGVVMLRGTVVLTSQREGVVVL